jgi:hypothetical protein
VCHCCADFVLTVCAARRVDELGGFAEFSPTLPSCVPPACPPLGDGILQGFSEVIGRVEFIFDEFEAIAMELRCVELMHRLELLNYYKSHSSIRLCKVDNSGNYIRTLSSYA